FKADTRSSSLWHNPLLCGRQAHWSFMKRNFFILSMSFIFVIALYAHGNILTDHSQIKELSSFRIMGE
ncbi:MAG: hypothetical protein KIG96_04260, partial [Treponema sp.]|nr:hypothetical protein [Treponema sp.]